MKHVKLFGIILLSTFVILFAITFIQDSGEHKTDIFKVEKNELVIDVKSTGEIIALNTVKIMPPDLFFDRNTNVYHTTISKLVAEGTILKKGDFVATLDGAEVDRQIKRYQERYDNQSNEIETLKVDSSIQVNKRHNAIMKAKDDVQTAEFTVQQAVYESKAIQRQAQIKLERAKRELENVKNLYEQAKLQQHKRINRVRRHLKWSKWKLEKHTALKDQFTITSPASGMLIYARHPYNNQKIKEGSRVTKWRTNMSIATIPDLKDLYTEMYINEIDITKVHLGQEVEISADALPDHQYSGVVKEIASYGKASNENSYRLFRVLVQLEGDLNDLKPAMTTNNRIVINAYEDVIYIPLKAVYGDNSKAFVYKKKGLGTVRQEVVLGEQNSEYVLVNKGLDVNDQVLMQEPENTEKLKTLYLEPDMAAK